MQKFANSLREKAEVWNASQIDFNQLEIIEKDNKKVLGSGGFGSVKLVRDRRTSKLYALKEVQ